MRWVVYCVRLSRYCPNLRFGTISRILDNYIFFSAEGSHRGLLRSLGKRVYRKVSWVRIPPLPHCRKLIVGRKRICRKASQVQILYPPPIFRLRLLGDFCLAPPEAGLGFGKDFEGISEVAKQFLPAQTEVRTNLF